MKLSSLQQRFYAFLGIGVLVLTIGLWGCSESDKSPVSSDASFAGQLSLKNPAVQSVMAVQIRHTKALMARTDVIGTATTINEAGEPAVMILVTSESALLAAPTELDGVPVRVVLTDPIIRMKGRPGGGGGGGGGVSHTAIQTPPIQLGTSGG